MITLNISIRDFVAALDEVTPECREALASALCEASKQVPAGPPQEALVALSVLADGAPQLLFA